MNKKILFITSFYSGIKDSIMNDTWDPNGMPAIYKLLEGIENSVMDFDYCFFDSLEGDKIALKNKKFRSTNFYVLNSNHNKWPYGLNFLQSFWIANNKFRKIQKSVILAEYDLIYIDRSNIELIPFLAKRFSGKILLRLHGVGSLYQSFKRSIKFRIHNYFKLLSFKTKIDFIISSMDGTPVEKFLSKYTSPKTSSLKLINGVDIESEVNRKTNKKIQFLFVGRLEKDKGIMEIINVFNSLPKEILNKLTLTIVGTGSLLKKIKEESKENPSLIFKGPIKHQEIRNLFLEANAFISLNFLGNISNVVLEAINYELAIITLRKDLKKGFDEESNDFLQDNVIYVDRNKIETQLRDIIEYLAKNPKRVKGFQEKVRKNLKPKLISWDKRVEIELDIINKLITG